MFLLAPIGLAASDDVAAILQFAGIGALIGAALAARMRIRNSNADPALPPLLWGITGALLGAVLVLSEQLF